MSPLSRFLLFLIIGLAVVIAGLWISGGKKEEYKATIEIKAQPFQIFPYFVEPDKLKRWMTGLEAIDEPLPPQEDSNNPPELIRTISDAKGKRTEYADKVIRFTPDEILTIQSSASGTVHTNILQLEPIDKERTQFSYVIRVSYNGLARLIAPVQSSPLQDRINTDVRRLKELVEANEPQVPYVPPPPKDKEKDKPQDSFDEPVPDISELGDFEDLK